MAKRREKGLAGKARAERRKKTIEQKIASYYDSVSEEDREEESRWGEFALAQFVESS